jgi:hypothetical protein
MLLISAAATANTRPTCVSSSAGDNTAPRLVVRALDARIAQLQVATDDARAALNSANLFVAAPAALVCDTCQPLQHRRILQPHDVDSNDVSNATSSTDCIPLDSFLSLSFAEATLVRSNLGGQGGRCTVLGVCDELQTASTPREIYFRNVGIEPNTFHSIDLRITNHTEVCTPTIVPGIECSSLRLTTCVWRSVAAPASAVSRVERRDQRHQATTRRHRYGLGPIRCHKLTRTASDHATAAVPVLERAVHLG